MKPPIPLPASLSRLLAGARFAKDTIGCSTSAVFKVCGLPEVGDAYLKVVEPVAGEDLLREKAVLDWLQGRLPVPRVLYFIEQFEIQYLLISAIPGLGAENEYFLSTDNTPGMVRELARGLRQIHSLDIGDCPFPRHLDTMLAEAGRRVELGLVSPYDFQPKNTSRAPEDILQELMDKCPKDEDLVFTHGDYCLPNIILQDRQLSGFIDWGRAGVADRYADIALAVRSLRYNLGDRRGVDLARLFLEEYGLEQADEEKIAYFILLDELF
jgi:aminoglycoside phosphotransferase